MRNTCHFTVIYLQDLTFPSVPWHGSWKAIKQIETDTYQEEKEGNLFLLPSLSNVIGYHTITSLKTDKPQHGPRVKGVPASMLHFWEWNWVQSHGASGRAVSSGRRFQRDKVIVKQFAGGSSSPSSWRSVEEIDLWSLNQLVVILFKRNLWKWTHPATIISYKGGHLESCCVNKKHLASSNKTANVMCRNIFIFACIKLGN